MDSVTAVYLGEFCMGKPAMLQGRSVRTVLNATSGSTSIIIASDLVVKTDKMLFTSDMASPLGCLVEIHLLSPQLFRV